jgi:hypothetical protein
MNNKILIGSIIAIAVLIGVSFTSVVGYRSVTSDVKESPLFNIRTSRAINEKTSIQTCRYFGIGEDAGIPIPKRNSTYVLISKIIDRINNMDKREINRLNDFIIAHQNDIADYVNKIENNKNIDIDKVKHFIDDIGILDNGNFTHDITIPICLVIWLIESVIYIILFAFFGLPFIILVTSILAIGVGSLVIASAVLGCTFGDTLVCCPP